MDSRICLGITTIQLYVAQDQGDYTRTALALRDDAHVGLHACAQGLYIPCMPDGGTATRPVHSKNPSDRTCMHANKVSYSYSLLHLHQQHRSRTHLTDEAVAQTNSVHRKHACKDGIPSCVLKHMPL